MGTETEMKRGIFFDLYGTLIDILTDEYDLRVYSTLSQYLSYHLVRVDPEKLRTTYFEEIQDHLNQNKEPYPEVDLYQVFSNIMYRYGNREYSKDRITDTAMLFRSLTMRHFDIFAGLYEVLTSLAEKYELGIISDAQWIFAEPEMEMLNLTPFFKITVLSSRIGIKKPDARLFHIAMERMRVRPEESVYIGDNPQKDMEGAKKAGMRFILMGSGWKANSDFKPDGCFTNYSELLKILGRV
jgi:putative hydrolase of the HAD superfamily